MPRLRNEVTGAVVQIREGKSLGAGWIPVDTKPTPKRTREKPAEKKTEK